MLRFLPLLILPLAGCTTMAEMQSQDPKLTLTSNLTPDQVEGCISRGLSASFGTPNVIRDAGRRVLDYNMDGVSSFASITIIEGEPVTIEGRGNGSVFTSRRRQIIEACAAG